MSISARAATFRRLNLGGIRHRPLPALLAALGIALGAALVIATQLLTASLTHPFEELPTFAGPEMSELRSNVAGRVPVDLLDDMAAVDGVGGVARIWTSVTPADPDGDSPSLRLLAVDDPSGLFPPIDLSELAPDAGLSLANPSAAHVILLEPAARELGLVAGDTLDLPGQPLGSIVVAAVAEPPEGPLAELDEGRIALFAPQALSALLGIGDDASLAYVNTGSADEDALEIALGDRGEIIAPEAALPPAIGTTVDSLSTLTICGLVIGLLIAANTLLVAAADRFPAIAAASLIGGDRRQLLAGMAGEGAVIGLVGGLASIPLGLGLGWLLVELYGASMLAGAGVGVSLVSSSATLTLGPLAGILVGAAAGAHAGRRILSTASLHAQSGAVDRALPRPPRRWPALAGVVLLFAAAAVMRGLGRGELPLQAGQLALVVGPVGLVLVGQALVAPAAGWLLRLGERFSPLTARLAKAEIDAAPARLGAVVTILALAAGMACGFMSAADLGVETTSALVAERLGDGQVLVTVQEPFDQRSAAISQTVVTDLAERSDLVTTRSRSILSGTPGRAAIGVAPSTEAIATVVDSDDPSALAASLAEGEIALSQLAAGRLGVGAGDVVTLPTLAGEAEFTVAAIVGRALPDDSTLGDFVLASSEVAAGSWGALPVSVVVRGQLDDVQTTLAELSEGFAYDPGAWSDQVTPHLVRFFDPFTLTGEVFLLTAAVAVTNLLLIQLAQRRRQRAVLAALGRDDGAERKVVAVTICVTTALAAVLGFVGTNLFTWWLSLASTAYYGFRLDWGLAPPALLGGALALIAAALVASLPPLAAAGRVEAVAALRAE